MAPTAATASTTGTAEGFVATAMAAATVAPANSASGCSARRASSANARAARPKAAAPRSTYAVEIWSAAAGIERNTAAPRTALAR